MTQSSSFKKLESKGEESTVDLNEEKTKFFFKKKINSIFNYFSTLNTFYKPSFLFFLVNNYFFNKGVIDQSLFAVRLPLIDALKLGSNENQLLALIQNIPWAIKGLIGVISDIFPIFGYHKRSYMGIFGFISSVFSVFLVAAFIGNIQLLQKNFWLILLSYLFITLTPSSFDLLCEGKYTEIMIDHPETKSGIVSFVWFWQSLGAIFTSSYLGVVSQAYGATPILCSVAVLTVQISVCAAFNMINDKKVEKEKANRINVEKAKSMSVFLILGVVTGVSLLISAVISITQSTTTQFIYLWTVAIILIAVEYYILPTALANVNLYMFLASAAVPRLPGILEVWYTSTKCVVNGPMFSLSYYKTITPLIGGLAQLGGVVIFQLFMSSWSYRKIQFLAGVATILAATNDYIIINRWNVNYLGISDHAMYTIGDAIIQNLVAMLLFIPGTILLSRICPRSIESTVFAIFAGFANFGSTVASATGSFLLEVTGTEINEHQNICNYSALSTLVLVCNIVCIAAFIPISIFLLPPNKMSEPLSEAEFALQNSLLNKNFKIYDKTKNIDEKDQNSFVKP